MTLMEKIILLKREIKAYNAAIPKCVDTIAGREVKQELIGDRNEKYYELGKLCSNSAVKICLQSEYIQ